MNITVIKAVFLLIILLSSTANQSYSKEILHHTNANSSLGSYIVSKINNMNIHPSPKSVVLSKPNDLLNLDKFMVINVDSNKYSELSQPNMKYYRNLQIAVLPNINYSFIKSIFPENDIIRYTPQLINNNPINDSETTKKQSTTLNSISDINHVSSIFNIDPLWNKGQV